jgi:FeS assembly SUF system protein
MSDETTKLDAPTMVAPTATAPTTVPAANPAPQAGDAAVQASASAAPASASPARASESAAPGDPTKFIEQKLIEGKVIEALQQIFDPEIPVNIYELGLIYHIQVEPDNSVLVKMTLTAPACPVAGTLPGEVEQKINAIPEVKEAKVELVWDPPWTREMMSESAMLQLGF